MPLKPGLLSTVELATAFAVSAAVLTVFVVETSGRALSRPARNTYRWLAAGAVIMAVGLTVATMVARHTADAQPFAVVVAVASAAAAVPLVVGLLRLRGLSMHRVAPRHAVYGLVFAAGLFIIGWLIIVVANSGGSDLGLTLCFVVTSGSVWLVSSVAGVVTMVIAWAVKPRAGATLAAAGVVLVMLGGSASVLAWCLPVVVTVTTTALPLAVGGVALAGSAWWAARIPYLDPPTSERPPHPAYLVVAICALVAGGIYEVVTQDSVDLVWMLAPCVLVFTLVARMALALRETRDYTRQLERANADFKTLAHTDPLTGLGNRRELLRALPADPSGVEATLLTLDLDEFKNVNDLKGHDVGDAVLAEVGRRLRASVRPEDVPVRLGGDEFAVLAYTAPEQAQRLADRLLTVLSRPYEVGDGPVYLSGSIGLVGCASASSVEDLLRNADLALHHAKQGGKNRADVYDEKYDAARRRRIKLEQGLRQAIELDQLTLGFQPVVALPEGVPVGMEALLRWHHKELGMVPPSEFIPVAEETGRIKALGRWTVHTACRQLARWLAEGHDLWLAVNVSVRELRAPRYAEYVAEVLRANRLSGDRLVLEVTEESVAKDAEVLAEPLNALRELGVRVALDDFGAGYSSLGQLRKLPVDILKVDRALIADLIEGPGAGAPPLVDVVVQLAQRLKLAVVAEGLEDRAQRAIVERAGCGLGQGYLFGRAVPAERVSALMARTDGAVTGA